MSDWQPISTAPKDGTDVLVWGTPEGGGEVLFLMPLVCSAYWDVVDSSFCLTGADWTGPFIKPSHWMPLPEPPQVEQAAA